MFDSALCLYLILYTIYEWNAHPFTESDQSCPFHTILMDIQLCSCCKRLGFQNRLLLLFRTGGSGNGWCNNSVPFYRACSRHWRRPFKVSRLTAEYSGDTIVYVTPRQLRCNTLIGGGGGGARLLEEET
jgi:hypothetical protein